MITYESCIKHVRSVGDKNACVPIAYAIALQKPIDRVLEVFAVSGRKRGHGTPDTVRRAANRLLKMEYSVVHPLRCKTVGKIPEHYPEGAWLCLISGHMFCVRDGVVHDWTDGRRHRIKSMMRVIL
jgi:hypothetical protein